MRNKRGDIIVSTVEIEGILRNYYDETHIYKSDNLKSTNFYKDVHFQDLIQDMLKF